MRYNSVINFAISTALLASIVLSGCFGQRVYVYEKIPEYLGEFVGLHKFSFDFTVSFIRYLENYFKITGSSDGYDWLIGRFIKQTDYILYYQKINDFEWINVNHKEDYFYAKELSKRLMNNS
jgi:hypothetical protein